MQGIYMIKNITNNKVYIGQAEDIEQRWKDHIKNLKNGRHINKHLLSAWNKYGQPSFEFSIIEESDNRFEREVYWIEYYKSYNQKFGYNKTMGGEKGKEHFTQETIEKIRKKAAYWTGKDFSEAHRENLSKARIGKKHTEETKRKIGDNWKGRQHTEESIQKMKDAKIGKSFSDEGKLKLSYQALERLGLTEEQLIEIYNRSQNGERQKVLSKEFGINLKCVSNIKTKKIFELLINNYLTTKK